MSKYNPEIHHRRSIRLKGYDYSQAGMYFVTICVQNREHLFGEIVDGEMILNDAGKMVEKEWVDLKNRFPNIELHEFVVMPNHFHGIIQIVDNVGGGGVGAIPCGCPVQNGDISEIGQSQTQSGQTQTQFGQSGQPRTGQPQGIAPTPVNDKNKKTIGDMMDAFKSIVTVLYIRGVKTLDWQPFYKKLWQRNYHEHIIRNGNEYQYIANYIENNPANWQHDTFYKEEI
ncbi:MAG: transposase [Bacteroidetes bacterium]|nr:transposase [Bacteroidota bacterium]